jgi:hypothetical protein
MQEQQRVAVADKAYNAHAQQQTSAAVATLQLPEASEPKLPHPSPNATEAVKKASPPQAEIIGSTPQIQFRARHRTIAEVALAHCSCLQAMSLAMWW